MGVSSDGSYGIPEGIVFSFPVFCTAGGEWSIVKGLPVGQEGELKPAVKYAKDKVALTLAELVEERDEALAFLESSA